MVTFGRTTVGSTGISTADFYECNRGSPSTGGTGNSIFIYMQAGTNGRKLKGALFNYNTKALIANSTTDELTDDGTGGWKQLDFGATKPTIVAGTVYAVGAVGDTAAQNTVYDTLSGTGSYESEAYATFPPDPIVGWDYQNVDVSTYCDYTESGWGGAKCGGVSAIAKVADVAESGISKISGVA